MTPKITICYVTCRRDPKWAWFVDSLCAQTTDKQRENLEVIFIDGHLWDEPIARRVLDAEVALCNPSLYDGPRFRLLEAIIRGRFVHRHIPPKPCAWNGPFRQTSSDFFCASNTRNTAFIVAEHPYLVFVDDLSVLGPQWFNQVIHAAQDEYVVCGSYKKVKQLKVVDGRIESFEPFPSGVDSRWDRGSDGGVVPWSGGGLYGCSFGIPLEAALEVDGFDGIGNGGGFEDCDFGIRVERAGWAFFYNRNMLTLESEEDHHTGESPTKFRKLVTRDRLPKNYDGYQIPNQAEKYWSDHVMLNRLCNETDRIQPLIGDSLRAARAHFLATGLVALPQPNQVDWRDGTPLKDL